LIVLRAQQTNEEDNNDDANVNIEKDAVSAVVDDKIDIAGILGTIASIVVLRSEFVLKTTGCGLPAGPFGIVGAVEGMSYLGVVATSVAAAISYFSSYDDDDERNSNSNVNIAGRLAVSLSCTAIVFGIAVLAFQLTDYGYIPNAVPMEGAMCK